MQMGEGFNIFDWIKPGERTQDYVQDQVRDTLENWGLDEFFPQSQTEQPKTITKFIQDPKVLWVLGGGAALLILLLATRKGQRR